MYDKTVISGMFTLLMMAFALFIYGVAMIPVAALADKKCIEAGYPKSRVTWDFEAYCITLEGAVTVPVVKMKDMPRADEK